MIKITANLVKTPCLCFYITPKKHRLPSLQAWVVANLSLIESYSLNAFNCAILEQTALGQTASY